MKHLGRKTDPKDIVTQDQLGTAAAATLTTSDADATSGRVVRNGNYGLFRYTNSIVAGQSADSFNIPGARYYIQGSTTTNIPITETGWIIVDATGDHVGGERLTQSYISAVSGRRFVRSEVTGTFGAWREQLTNSSLVAGAGITVTYSSSTGQVAIAAAAVSSTGIATKENFQAKVLNGLLGYTPQFADVDIGWACGILNTNTLPIGSGYSTGNSSEYADASESTLTITGTNASVSSRAPTVLSTGTTTTGTITWSNGRTLAGITNGGLRYNQMASMTYQFTGNIQTISTATDRFVCEMGVTSGGLSSKQAWFSCVDNVNGGRWLFSYVNNAGSTVTVDTGITPSAGIDIDASITWTWIGSAFALVATLSTFTSSTLTSLAVNLSLSSTVAWNPYMSITKSAGTTARAFRFRRHLMIGTVQ